MQTVLEQGSIDKPLTFDVGLIQLSFIPVCSLNTCNISVKLCQAFAALQCFSLTLGACAPRVTVLVLSVCVCVCFPYSGTSRNQAYKQQYQRLQRDTGMKYKKGFFLKRFVPKLWRRLLTSSSSGVVSGMLVPFFRRN